MQAELLVESKVERRVQTFDETVSDIIDSSVFRRPPRRFLYTHPGVQPEAGAFRFRVCLLFVLFLPDTDYI